MSERPREGGCCEWKAGGPDGARCHGSCARPHLGKPERRSWRETGDVDVSVLHLPDGVRHVNVLLPVVTRAAEAAVVAALAVDAAGLTPGRGGTAVVRSQRFVEVV